jgi:hypothetical protein
MQQPARRGTYSGIGREHHPIEICGSGSGQQLSNAASGIKYGLAQSFLRDADRECRFAQPQQRSARIVSATRPTPDGRGVGGDVMPSIRRVDLVINLAHLRQAVGVKRINQLPSLIHNV